MRLSRLLLPVMIGGLGVLVTADPAYAQRGGHGGGGAGGYHPSGGGYHPSGGAMPSYRPSGFNPSYSPSSMSRGYTPSASPSYTSRTYTGPNGTATTYAGPNGAGAVYHGTIPGTTTATAGAIGVVARPNPGTGYAVYHGPYGGTVVTTPYYAAFRTGTYPYPHNVTINNYQIYTGFGYYPYGLFLGVGAFGYGGYGYGYGMGGYGGYGYGGGQAYAANTDPYAGAVQQPADTDAPPPTPEAPPDAAIIHVTVPDGNAEVFLNGQKTRSTGAVRNYATPRLEPGKVYTYELKSVWTANGQPVEANKIVEVQAGQVTNIDLTAPPPAKSGFGGGVRTFP
jgi:uncharacterized protein (TIGR03000 family)